MSDHPEDFSHFLDFIDNQLDLSGLVETSHLSDSSHFSDDEIEQLVMPLIREDIQVEMLRLMAQLLRTPQRDHWRAQLAPFHRELRQCLARTVGSLMAQRYPNRMVEDEWLDVASFIITVAWLVRKQMDSDDCAPAEN